MFKAIKEFFLGKPVETQAPKIEEVKPVVEEVQPVVETKVDPMAVALDLEPVDFAVANVPVAEKKPRKPRAPKAAVEAPVKAAKPKAAKAPKEKKPAAMKAPTKLKVVK